MIGRQPVVLTRDDAGSLRLWSNRCPHRGATVCGLDLGPHLLLPLPVPRVDFDTAGALAALPGEEGFGPTFDRARRTGSASVPRMDQYRGSCCSGRMTGRPWSSTWNACEIIHRLRDRWEISLRAGRLCYRIRANWRWPPRTCATSTIRRSRSVPSA